MLLLKLQNSAAKDQQGQAALLVEGESGVQSDSKAGRSLNVTEQEEPNRSCDVNLLHPAVQPSLDKCAAMRCIQGQAGKLVSKAASGSARYTARYSTPCPGAAGEGNPAA